VGAAACDCSPLIEAVKAQLLTRSVLHADETRLPMLKLAWSHAPGVSLELQARANTTKCQTVIYDFTDGRGVSAREFLGSWTGKFVCDDYAACKALFDRGIIERAVWRTRAETHDYTLIIEARSRRRSRYWRRCMSRAREARRNEARTPMPRQPASNDRANRRF